KARVLPSDAEELMNRLKWSAIAILLAAVAVVGQAPEVPKDLRPLLTPRHSEMTLILTRYNADRNLLISNYAGVTNAGARGGRGARGAAPQEEPLVISTPRIARLKRFDTSWQTALNRLDNPKLSNDARQDLSDLKTTIQKNLAELDVQTQALGGIMPLIPFTPDLVALIEARIAIKDIDSEKAAGTLT